ncbi:MAG TPA: hypothetical protein VLF93_02735 [Candidatus Saccharimonadales bacterium]|nr:hypothetical protein [Candidatus Saccharimonadales bacterium]
MRKEGGIPNNELLRGNDLKRAVRRHMEERVQRRREEGSDYLPLSLAMLANLDFIDPDWSKPRSMTEVTNTIGSFCASFHYAHLMVGAGTYGNFADLFNVPYSTTEKWAPIIGDTMDDPKMKADFQTNAWRPPTTVFPERYVPLQYILSHRFGTEPVTIADLGTGLHAAIPLLNSEDNKRYNFPGKDLIQQYSADVNVAFGIGVDSQERDPSWAQSSIWPVEGGIKRILQFSKVMATLVYQYKKDSQKMPFLQQDITSPRALENIQQAMQMRGQGTKVRAVNSGFVRQFFGSDSAAQQQHTQLAYDLLEDRGIFIDCGAENVTSYSEDRDTKINVYEKNEREKRFVHLGTPFILENQIDIDSTSLSYFTNPNNRLVGAR